MSQNQEQNTSRLYVKCGLSKRSRSLPTIRIDRAKKLLERGVEPIRRLTGQAFPTRAISPAFSNPLLG